MEKARTVLYYKSVPTKWWAEAVSTAVYLINRSTNASHTDITPAMGNRPMLTNVVQTNLRIYTMVTVKLLRHGGSGDEENSSADGLVLRSFSYLKEFGEWKTPTLPEKRNLAAASIGSHRGRFDLTSQDGSVALELEVPTGTDAQTDYYLVK
ncbi:hypothetical protein PPTG_15485 [Phytophthora nicotianae INRA-310]|uniref:Uncharacterized protein n=1 Tax=Phytophthora nicotianae (strain INRA-310) TaxID=761204 RepID=W2PRU1_PHYN3|nr:hypothetical protein PPTG_15485 [Phytophthora nicotianae INRA-310]ETN02730.1 hypothetical protein PPTG_15485 [Phytophthora nicotianae INRA-310]